MRLLTALLCVITASLQLASGQVSKGLIDKIYIANDGQVHIVERGIDVVAPKETDQVACQDPKLAEGGQVAGWLVDFSDCCTSYPLPLSLVIYRNGRVIQRFQPGQSIWDWKFLNNGKQVAFWMGPTHGDFEPHFELHEVSDGRLLATWDGHLTKKHPGWISGLKEKE